jgi:CHAD domain-containing protein
MHYLDGTIAGEDIEDLHAMRVSTRRLRSAMRNFRACFNQEQFAVHAARLRELGAVLGTVRDMDVRIAWMRSYRQEAPVEEHAGIEAVIERAVADREAARVPLVEFLEQLRKHDYEREFLAFIWAGEDRGQDVGGSGARLHS